MYTMAKRGDELCRLRLGDTQKDSIRLQIDQIDIKCKNRKKAAAVLPESEAKVGYDIDKEFEKDLCFNQDDCMWLSSDCSFHSSSFSHSSLDEWFSSWLLISESSNLFGGRGIIFFDGSSINPIEEASLALEKTDAEKILLEDLKEEEVLTWLLSSTGVDSSVTCIGGPDSSSSKCSEDSTGSENSTTYSTNLNLPPWDLDRTGFWVSLLNLDGKYSKWISDTESELNYFQSDCPSPSFKSSCGSECVSSRSSVMSSNGLKHEKSEYGPFSEHALNYAELGNLSSDDPLFWPFDSKFDWSSSDCFSMSPRRGMGRVGSPVNKSLNFSRKATTKKECNERHALSSTSIKSKILVHKHEDDKKCAKMVKTTTSRLRNSSKAFMKIVPFDMKYDIIEATGEYVSKERLPCTNPNPLEGDFASHEELQIESLMGLGEFDGHEGVELEFNKDDFFLDESI